MTGAERGTAIHAFLQSVPFTQEQPDLVAEVERQTALRLLDPALAKVLDLNVVRPFFESAAYRRIRHASRILREEPFITRAARCPRSGRGPLPAQRGAGSRALPTWC